MHHYLLKDNARLLHKWWQIAGLGDAKGIKIREVIKAVPEYAAQLQPQKLIEAPVIETAPAVTKAKPMVSGWDNWREAAKSSENEKPSVVKVSARLKYPYDPAYMPKKPNNVKAAVKPPRPLLISQPVNLATYGYYQLDLPAPKAKLDLAGVENLIDSLDAISLTM
jgi:hypothetical protein